MSRTVYRDRYEDDRVALVGGRVDHIVRPSRQAHIVITACGKHGTRASEPTGRPCTACSNQPWALDQRTYLDAEETTR
ncbi:hypothetical protein ACFC1T_27795 [Kitasatospora sp. NPDC056076]|uniref:hypothetical protein n=1 Tax=Kitasatospora sp. NPDC056076 TaxID=3345703 RepID=UPI0035E18BCA